MSKAFVSQVQEAKDAQEPKQFILVCCRNLNSEENVALSKHFKQIVVYHHELNSGVCDLTKFQFDLLIVDISKRENHDFLEVVSGQAKALSIPTIVLKKSMTNYESLVEALEATVIKNIKELDSENFFKFLSKTKLPKFKGRSLHILKSCLGFLLKQSV